MTQLIREPLFYIYFIYGISFIVMFAVIYRGAGKATSMKLVSTFYLLAFFGLTHGTAELIDWVRFIHRTLGVEESTVLTYLSQIFMVLSFVLLMQFGINLLTYKAVTQKTYRAIPAVLFIIYIMIILSSGQTNILQAGLTGRYEFGFTGSLLSAITLFKLGNTMKALGNSRLVKGLTTAAIAFVCYALVGGLITKPIAGLPIQLFRSVCAVTIAIASFSILEVFKVEH